MPEGKDLLDTIEAVHAAGLGEKVWSDVLTGVTKLFGGCAASLEVFTPPLQRPKEFYGFGIPRAGELAYLEQYAALNPRAAYAFQHTTHELLWDYQVLDERAMNAIRSTPGCCRKWNCATSWRASSIAREVNWSVCRCIGRRKQGHVGPDEIGLMKRLLPHFRQALDTSMRLKRAAAFGQSLERALDWLSDGVTLIVRDGRVLYANELLRAIARRNDGIRIWRETIAFAAADARARFDAALGSVRRMRAGGGVSLPSDFPVARGSAPPYLVSVRPLARAARDDEAEAIVFVHDPLRRNAGMVRVLREVYGLTEAEASVADALQAGTPFGDYARERGVSLNTIYTHLRHIKEKTRCKRLAELIRKLNDLQVPLRID